MKTIKGLLEQENIAYNSLSNYELAFKHTSFINESKTSKESYERLEFLGDAILGMLVSEHLYTNHPEYDQGDMTLIKHYFVNKDALVAINKEVGLKDFIFLGVGSADKPSDSILADIVESFIGAIYLDAGYEEVKKWVASRFFSKIDATPIDQVKDSKTRLQELLQLETRKSVTYRTDNGTTTEESKDKIFTSQAIFDNNVIGEGTGRSKKDAEKAAASDAIERMAK